MVLTEFERPAIALVVEEIVPGESGGRIERRICEFIKAGVEMVWLVDPLERAVTVYRHDAELEVFEEANELPTKPALRVVDLIGNSQS